MTGERVQVQTYTDIKGKQEIHIDDPSDYEAIIFLDLENAKRVRDDLSEHIAALEEDGCE